MRQIGLDRVLASLVLAAWVATVFVVFVPAPGPLRVIAGLALTIVLPGWLLTYVALPPAAGEGRLRFVLAFGLSLVATITIGITLALATGRVDRDSAALALASLSTLIAVAAHRRTRGGFSPVVPRLPHLGARGGAILAVGAGLLVVVIVLAVKLFSLDTEAMHFTQLSVVRSKGQAFALIQNHESGARSYRWVVLRSSGKQLRSGSLELAKDQSSGIRLRPPAGLRRLRIELFLNGSSKPYLTATYVR